MGNYMNPKISFKLKNSDLFKSNRNNNVPLENTGNDGIYTFEMRGMFYMQILPY